MFKNLTQGGCNSRQDFKASGVSPTQGGGNARQGMEQGSRVSATANLVANRVGAAANLVANRVSASANMSDSMFDLYEAARH